MHTDKYINQGINEADANHRAMILQLNPMIPIKRLSDGMEGYAFLVIDYSQEHDLLFTCAMDDGEIWTLNNREIRFCKNISLDRK